jgi:hypothetical protein
LSRRLIEVLPLLDDFVSQAPKNRHIFDIVPAQAENTGGLTMAPTLDKNETSDAA